MFKRILAVVGVLALTIGLVALVAGPASAHDHVVTPSCVTGVTVNLTNYHVDKAGDTPNHVTVIVDGTTVVNNVAFGATFVNTYAWPSAVPQATHSYRVSVVAVDDVDGKKGWSFDTWPQTISGCAQSSSAGSVDHTDPYCTPTGTVGSGGYTIPNIPAAVYTVTIAGVSTVTAPGTYALNPGTTVHVVATPATTGYTLTGQTVWDFTIGTIDSTKCTLPTDATATAPVVLAATCSTGQSLTLGTVVNATWGTVTGGTGPSTYSVTATAVSGHLFPGRTTTELFTGTLLGPLSPTDPSCAAPPVCIPNSSVSYTYDPTTNSGDITVTDVTNSTGTLCQPFWVTATSWHYTTYQSYFPQVRDVVQKLPQIKSAGVYHFNAAVTCGQGDIYASFSTQPDPTENLYGPNDPFDENTLGLMGFNGPAPTYVQQNLNCMAASSGDPVYTEETCDTGNPGKLFSGTYTITPGVHVSYQVQINSGAYAVVAPGTYDVSPGDVVTIKVVPDTGYLLDPVPDPSTLTHTFGAARDCLVTALPAKPDATSQSCVPAGNGGSQGQLSSAAPTDVLTDAFITIPNTTGVQYFIDLKAYDPGKVILPPGSYTVTAQAKTGYTLDTTTYPVSGWVETLTSAEPCGDLITDPLVQPIASQVQLGCFSGGSFTLSNDLSDPKAISWTVNGAAVSITSAPTTFTVTTPSTIEVHAQANGPVYGLEAGAQQDWTFVFAESATCDLKTLALTGSSPTGLLGLGYLMLVSGLGLVAVRLARRRGTQV